ncbi:hypothetical protein [Streptomyces zhihengii]|uniref:hypothetical protein n=1 Tax=Streptomyces zhihengii TaxID=1818004 RepID=UPI00339E0F21
MSSPHAPTASAPDRTARPGRVRRVAGAAVVAASLALAGTACSGDAEKRSFTVPSDLCGTPVPAAALDPVLPTSGEKLTADAKSREVGDTHCRVAVDGESVLSVFSERRADPSVAKVARGNPHMDLSEHTSEDGTYMWSGQGGVRSIACPAVSKEHPDRGHVFVRVLIYDENRADADAAKDLVLAVAKSVAASEECTSGA